jgi:glyoxylase-like metal-dependent hydrolase (beta-lactamase superfamily II)
MPYLTGRSKYPPPDPAVRGGALAMMAPLCPRGPIDVSDRLHSLPEDGTVPGLSGWRWIHTPGHTAGHVSFFREEDRILIVGDAFVTTRQESFSAVLRQRPELHGPPDQIARPAHGRYVRRPAVTDQRGIVSLPPPVYNRKKLAIIGAGIAAGAETYLLVRRRAA